MRAVYTHPFSARKKQRTSRWCFLSSFFPGGTGTRNTTNSHSCGNTSREVRPDPKGKIPLLATFTHARPPIGQFSTREIRAARRRRLDASRPACHFVFGAFFWSEKNHMTKRRVLRLSRTPTNQPNKQNLRIAIPSRNLCTGHENKASRP